MLGSAVMQKIFESRRKNASKLLYWLQDEDAHNIFAFVGGFVDSAGYMKLQGLFTSSITGNLIAATASIYHTYGVVARIFVALFFAVGALFTSGAMFKLKHRGWSGRSLLVFGALIEVAALALTILFGMLLEDKIDVDHSLGSWQLIFVAAIMAFSMGAQCAFVKDSFPNCPSTTVITMLLVTFSSQGAHGWNYLLAVNGWHELIPADEEKSEKQKQALLEKHVENTQKFISTTRQLVSFLLGGVIGAAIMENATFWSLFVPIGILLLIVIDVEVARRRDALAKATAKDADLAPPSQSEIDETTGQIEGGDLENYGDSTEDLCGQVSDGQEGVELLTRGQEATGSDDIAVTFHSGTRYRQLSH